MLENIQTSIRQLRKEDLSIENILALCNNIILELKNTPVPCQEIKELRKQLNLMIYFINETYNSYQNQLNKIPLAHLLEAKKQELDQILKELDESQDIVDETNKVIKELNKEKQELEKNNQRYIQLTKEKETLQQTIKQYKEIDEQQLINMIHQLREENKKLQEEKEQLTKQKQQYSKEKQEYLQTIKQIKEKNQTLKKELQTQQKQLKTLEEEYQFNTTRKENIYKDIEKMKDKLSQIERIPNHILEEYNQFEQELKKKKTQLNCLLEEDENKTLEKRIFKKTKELDATQKISQTLQQLKLQSEQLFEQYKQIQRIGIRMKEGKL